MNRSTFAGTRAAASACVWSIAIVLGTALLWAPAALASCGSAVCSVNTDWAAHGAFTEPGLKLDVRAEYVPQDQLRNGAEKMSEPDHDAHHEENHTWNRNLITTLDYALSEQWGMSVAVPYIDRDHRHIHNHHEHGHFEKIISKWHITGVGDMRVLGRYQFARESGATSAMGVQFGLKLPTGATKEKNSDGEEAERTLQPGTGTTDYIAGAYYQRTLVTGLGWFIQAQRQAALSPHEDFRPGDRTTVDTGIRYEATSKLAALLQLNGQWRERDLGEMAETETSGGRAYFLSPGLAYAFTSDVQTYVFYQWSAYQYVNGAQLTADSAAVAGTSVRF